MKKRSIGLMVMLAIGCSLILAAGSYAGTKMPTEIKLEKEGFKTTKGVVTFNHQKHVADYNPASIATRSPAN